MTGGMTAGLLHTVPALADTFHQLLQNAATPPERIVHVVDPSLLAIAVATGVDDDVRAAVAAHVRHLQASGADAVMVTCSSLGEATDAAARRHDSTPVLRVDVPMGDEAVRSAVAGRRGHVVVLATLDSTLGPTGRLVGSFAENAGRAVTTEALVVEGAAAARSAGDHEEHDRLVAQAVESAMLRGDVVVLAQASMAPAADRVADARVPVLTSVGSGVDRLVEVLEGALKETGNRPLTP